MKNWNIKFFVIVFIIMGILTTPFFVFKTKAETDFNFLKFYDLNFNLKNQILLNDSAKGYLVNAIDLGGDGQDEILLTPQSGSRPWVKILRGDGSLINEFLAYDENFTGGVIAKGCDLNGDGRQEIVTAPYSAGGAHIRVFDSHGQPNINAGFFAFSKDLKTGVQIGCADVTGDGRDEIIAVGGEKYAEKELKIFNFLGEQINTKKLNLKGKNISIARVDLGNDGIEEILVGSGWLDEPKVQIYRGDLSLVNEFLAYDESFRGGVNVFGWDLKNDGQGKIITTAGLTGGTHLRIFDSYGQEKITHKTFIFSQDFWGGLSLTGGDFNGDGQLELLSAPQNLPIGEKKYEKYIEVDVTHQVFRYYQKGYLLGEFLTSTGKASTPTRLGEFTAFSKYEMAYGYADGVRWDMPYFIGFYKVGNIENGIHELPFLNSRREGAYSLGRAVSHGCVRLPIGVAKEVFDWVETGQTKVVVYK